MRQDRRVAIVVQLSDTHLVRDGGGGEPVDDREGGLAATTDALAGVRPDAVVVTGDITDDASREACVRVRDAARRLGGALVATAGNHDDPVVVRDVFGPQQTLAVGSWRVVLIDTTVPGRISGAIDVGAAVERLDAVAPAPTLVALHHPSLSASSHELFQLDGAPELRAALLDRPHVRVVVSGHLHESFEQRAGHVRFIGAPSTWFAMVHDGPEYRRDDGGATGAHVYDLADDGTFTWRLVRR
jgi:3',5'-cyclic-AMP phosphodiesterase